MANYPQSVQGGRSLRLCVLSALWESSRVYGYGGRRHLYSQRPRRPCLVKKRSTDLLHDPWYNKGTSFPATERDRLGLRGLLPPRIMTFEQQYERFMGNFRSLERQTKEGANDMVSLAKWRILNRLHDRNETLYYKVLIDNIEEFAPIIYTPTIGLVCQRYSGLFRRPRGMYFTAKDRGEMMSMIYNWPAEQVDMIVVTDGSRVLGLGDLGVQGIGISVGKLDIYVAAAGINPQRVMPVMIDVGTDNEKLLDNPQYLGIAQKRLEGEEYVAVVDEFMDAVFTRWPDVIVQGTAGVTLAGLFGAVRAKGLPISEIANQKIVVAGAGSAGVGVVSMVKQAMARMQGNNSTANTLARGNFWLLDRQGLVTKSRADLNIVMKEFARETSESQMEGGLQDGAGLLEVVNKVKPDVLLGLSGVGGIFTKEVLETLKTSGCPRPAIFPLSNPTSNAECTAKEAFQYGGPNVIFASGSPFKDVDLGNGKVGTSNQGNNMYLFPGIGLGTLLSGAHHISDGMLHAAAESLASIMTDENLRQGIIFPSISRIREITARVAAAVLKEAVKEDLAAGYRHVDVEELQQMIQDDEETLSYVERQMWWPEYSSLVFHQ